jgi:uncharacterized membrane protein
MKKRKVSSRFFWTLLGIINVLALLVPIFLLRGSETNDASLGSTLLLIGIVFFLFIADAISVLVAYAL